VSHKGCFYKVILVFAELHGRECLYCLRRNFKLTYDLPINFNYLPNTVTFYILQGQSHEKVGEVRVWCVSLGHN
jgi:hypothetical protein